MNSNKGERWDLNPRPLGPHTWVYWGAYYTAGRACVVGIPGSVRHRAAARIRAESLSRRESVGEPNPGTIKPDSDGPRLQFQPPCPVHLAL
jgi:hypothetical protein